MPVRPPASRRLPLGNDWEIEADLSLNGVPLAGGAVVVGWLSLTEEGAAIHATLQVNLVRDNIDARLWRGVLTGANINAHLAGLVGAQIWEVIVVNGTSMKAVRWVRVEATREI